ncbi:MAG: hypothetical protein R3A45_06680 [Bdellovibrionota bacterium]
MSPTDTQDEITQRWSINVVRGWNGSMQRTKATDINVYPVDPSYGYHNPNSPDAIEQGLIDGLHLQVGQNKDARYAIPTFEGVGIPKTGAWAQPIYMNTLKIEFEINDRDLLEGLIAERDFGYLKACLGYYARAGMGQATIRKNEDKERIPPSEPTSRGSYLIADETGVVEEQGFFFEKVSVGEKSFIADLSTGIVGTLQLYIAGDKHRFYTLGGIEIGPYLGIHQQKYSREFLKADYSQGEEIDSFTQFPEGAALDALEFGDAQHIATKRVTNAGINLQVTPFFEAGFEDTGAINFSWGTPIIGENKRAYGTYTPANNTFNISLRVFINKK